MPHDKPCFPLFEEIMFRRALYSVLKHYIGSSSAVWISSAAFAMMHMSLLQLPGLCFLAVIWQIFYLRSKSLWSSIILHFFNNVLSVAMLLIARALGFVD